MTDNAERRFEKRLRYNWPVWFAEDFSEILSQGQMIDLSSKGAAFSCYADKCPWLGQRITARFSVPRYEDDNAFDLENYIRDGYICRIDELSPYIRRVAVQFAEPLPFKPGETDTETTTDTCGIGISPYANNETQRAAEAFVQPTAGTFMAPDHSCAE